MTKNQKAKTIILEAVKEKKFNHQKLFKIQRMVSKSDGGKFARSSDLLKAYKDLVKEKKIKPNPEVEKILKKSRIRSLSGIVSITVLTKPFTCPGNCLYCPNIPQMPKSYLPDEPACMRAIRNNFDPFKQVKTRIESLKLTGHPTDKIELIILGGTWSFYPLKYQRWFIKRCFDAANGKNSKTLEMSQKRNETAQNRIIGITIETRPDYINLEEIKRLRGLGVTRVELGVQSIYDKVLFYNNRGNDTKSVAYATKLLRGAGFKITYHMMLNLPGSNLEMDEKMFKELFDNPQFMPDQLKIYPCVVLKDAPLYKLYLEKKYQPYSTNQLIDLLIKIKEKIPPYVRIIRVIRDIPSPDIIDGNKIPSLRQIVLKKMKELKKSCQCIRCREPRDEKINFKKIKLIKREYKTSNGKEIFLSYEEKERNKILAFLRLSLPTEWTFPFLKDGAIIRELHSYGIVAPLKDEGKKSNVQHKSLGKKLIKEAEKIVKREGGYDKIFVISGIGVRNYYRKLGYHLFKTYMVKRV